MKLLNHATSYLAGILLVVISVWAALFYVNMLDEIYDSMDDGLENQKILVMQKAARDSTILQQTEFEEGYYKFREVPLAVARQQKDLYQDTLMYMQNEKDFEPVRLLTTVFRHQGKFYELRLITSMVEEDDLIEDLFYSLLGLYVGLIASILLLNNLLLKRIWRPFYQLLQRLRQFRLEDPQPIAVEETNIDEFRLLNQTVEKLLQSNISTYNSQKAFIENASHELQTPLAISLNKLELLAESNNLQEAQLEQIGTVMQSLERLTRLNKSLLLLSKIENRQFAAEEPVNFQTLLEHIISDFSDQCHFRNLTVTLEGEEAPQVTMNPDLAMMLSLNLFKNAMVHNVNGGSIKVLLTATSFTIENLGKDTPLHPEKLFNRFYKEDTSGASTGLGLAIAKAICDLYGFQISYDYQQKHILRVQFRPSV
ncbi:sensor histidine kinase [Rufibacter immobilis]|uniref:histidine kinase n=1 Tax=Rufibacter immobilis TaxID=1348778 RepID=A0A3M9MZJ4_9BACT|nr:HAMP domain-containing sensor histidine kinase [Rufibacter immobilis]RNI30896.1 sensor histidine kinase [Rufibacter immobilis]